MERDKKIEMTESEFNFIQKQKQLKNEIENSKRKVTEQRNKLYLV